jgi:hypothetical protein
MDWKTLKAQLAPAQVTVTVELPYERTLQVTLGTLSYGEWMAVELAVPAPPVPRTIAGANGVKLPNQADVDYQQKLARVNEERAYRRLALALEKGGTVIPGADEAEKAQAIQRDLDAGVSNALLVWLTNAAMSGKVTAEAAAATFRSE